MRIHICYHILLNMSSYQKKIKTGKETGKGGPWHSAENVSEGAEMLVRLNKES